MSMVDSGVGGVAVGFQSCHQIKLATAFTTPDVYGPDMEAADWAVDINNSPTYRSLPIVGFSSDGGHRDWDSPFHAIGNDLGEKECRATNHGTDLDRLMHDAGEFVGVMNHQLKVESRKCTNCRGTDPLGHSGQDGVSSAYCLACSSILQHETLNREADGLESDRQLEEVSKYCRGMDLSSEQRQARDAENSLLPGGEGAVENLPAPLQKRYSPKGKRASKKGTSSLRGVGKSRPLASVLQRSEIKLPRTEEATTIRPKEEPPNITTKLRKGSSKGTNGVLGEGADGSGEDEDFLKRSLCTSPPSTHEHVTAPKKKRHKPAAPTGPLPESNAVHIANTAVYEDDSRKALQGSRQEAYVDGEAMFQCTFVGCSKECGDAIALSKHMRIHGDKPYVCHYDGCCKRFTEKSKLTRHFLIHTGEKPFECPFEGCGKAFSLDFNLRSHLRTHTGEGYACPFQGCCKRYVHQYKLRAHIVHHHSQAATSAEHLVGPMVRTEQDGDCWNGGEGCGVPVQTEGLGRRGKGAEKKSLQTADKVQEQLQRLERRMSKLDKKRQVSSDRLEELDRERQKELKEGQRLERALKRLAKERSKLLQAEGPRSGDAVAKADPQPVPASRRRRPGQKIEGVSRQRKRLLIVNLSCQNDTGGNALDVEGGGQVSSGRGDGSFLLTVEDKSAPALDTKPPLLPGVRARMGSQPQEVGPVIHGNSGRRIVRGCAQRGGSIEADVVIGGSPGYDQGLPLAYMDAAGISAVDESPSRYRLQLPRPAAGLDDDLGDGETGETEGSCDNHGGGSAPSRIQAAASAGQKSWGARSGNLELSEGGGDEASDGYSCGLLGKEGGGLVVSEMQQEVSSGSRHLLPNSRGVAFDSSWDAGALQEDLDIEAAFESVVQEADRKPRGSRGPVTNQKQELAKSGGVEQRQLLAQDGEGALEQGEETESETESEAEAAMLEERSRQQRLQHGGGFPLAESQNDGDAAVQIEDEEEEGLVHMDSFLLDEQHSMVAALN